MLRKPMLALIATAFLMCSAGLVQAQTTEAPISDDRAKAQSPTTEKAESPTTESDRTYDRDFDWGWLGLIGLLGLAGLSGRARDVMTTKRPSNVPNEPL